MQDAETVKTISAGAQPDQDQKRERVRVALETIDPDADDATLDALIDALAGGMEDDRVERTLKGQSGNPALLAQAREALADIRKIWGMDAPTKIGLGGPTGGPVGVGFVEVEMPPDGPDGSSEAEA